MQDAYNKTTDLQRNQMHLAFNPGNQYKLTKRTHKKHFTYLKFTFSK